MSLNWLFVVQGFILPSGEDTGKISGHEVYANKLGYTNTDGETASTQLILNESYVRYHIMKCFDASGFYNYIFTMNSHSPAALNNTIRFLKNYDCYPIKKIELNFYNYNQERQFEHTWNVVETDKEAIRVLNQKLQELNSQF